MGADAPVNPYIDSDLSLDFIRVVEQAAIACAHTMGQGDRRKSDHVAVEAMLHELDGRAQRIAIAPIPHVGLGEAINDRLKRAAAPRG